MDHLRLTLKPMTGEPSSSLIRASDEAAAASVALSVIVRPGEGGGVALAAGSAAFAAAAVSDVLGKLGLIRPSSWLSFSSASRAAERAGDACSAA